MTYRDATPQKKWKEGNDEGKRELIWLTGGRREALLDVQRWKFIKRKKVLEKSSRETTPMIKFYEKSKNNAIDHAIKQEEKHVLKSFFILL